MNRINNIKSIKDILYRDGRIYKLNVEEKLQNLVNYFMNKCLLVCGNNTYEIIECEVYLTDGDYKEHEDVYTHGASEQLDFGKWYDHGSGLDITIGNDGENGQQIKGGILIRGIYKRDSNELGKFISGPLNVKKEFFSNLGTIIEPVPSLHLQEKEKSENATIYRGRRVGLNKNKSIEFYKKPYRFITRIEKGHSFKDKEIFFQDVFDSNQITEPKEIIELLTYTPKFLK